MLYADLTCQGTTAIGTRCKRLPRTGSDWCAHHEPGRDVAQSRKGEDELLKKYENLLDDPQPPQPERHLVDSAGGSGRYVGGDGHIAIPLEPVAYVRKATS
jgi:hypothetical protein